MTRCEIKIGFLDSLILYSGDFCYCAFLFVTGWFLNDLQIPLPTFLRELVNFSLKCWSMNWQVTKRHGVSPFPHSSSKSRKWKGYKGSKSDQHFSFIALTYPTSWRIRAPRFWNILGKLYFITNFLSQLREDPGYFTDFIDADRSHSAESINHKVCCCYFCSWSKERKWKCLERKDGWKWGMQKLKQKISVRIIE